MSFLLLESGDRLKLESGDLFVLEVTVTTSGGNLLLENGDALLLENGDNFLLEGSAVAPSGLPAILLESGDFLLLEDGSRLLLEGLAIEPPPPVFAGGGFVTFTRPKDPKLPFETEEDDEELIAILSLLSAGQRGRN
jgi:hypothetical protein